jgi:hypothetical protein
VLKKIPPEEYRAGSIIGGGYEKEIVQCTNSDEMISLERLQVNIDCFARNALAFAQ